MIGASNGTRRRTLSSDGPNDRRQLGNCSSQRIKQDGYFAVRAVDQDWFPDYIIHRLSVVLLGYITERGYHTGISVAPRDPLAIVADTGPRYGTN